MMEPIRILLVDDHDMVRFSLATLLDSEGDFLVVGEAKSGAAAIQAAARLQPDVVIMDFKMDGMSGIEATRQIATTTPHIAVIMLSSAAPQEYEAAAHEAGAAACLEKDMNSPRLINTIRQVAHDIQTCTAAD